MTEEEYFLEVLRVCKKVANEDKLEDFGNFVEVLDRNLKKMDKEEAQNQISIIVGYLGKIRKESLENFGVRGDFGQGNDKFLEFLKKYKD